MSKLYFKYGSMNCGKSVDLLKTAHNYEKIGKNVLILTSAIDDRFGSDLVKSRIGISMPAKAINNNDNLFELVKKLDVRPNIVLVDEVQFMKRHHIEELSDVVDELNIPVICYGLRSDFKLQPFESSKYLLTIADKIEELKNICECGEKATVNARFENGIIQTEGKQIVVGDLEYKSICIKCYKKLINESYGK